MLQLSLTFNLCWNCEYLSFLILFALEENPVNLSNLWQSERQAKHTSGNNHDLTTWLRT